MGQHHNNFHTVDEKYFSSKSKTVKEAWTKTLQHQCITFLDILDAAKDSHSDCEWTPVYCCGISAMGGRPYQPLWEPHTRDAAGDRREEGWWGRVQCLSPDTPFFFCSAWSHCAGGPAGAGQKGAGSDSIWRCLECVLPQNPLLFWGEGGRGLGSWGGGGWVSVWRMGCGLLALLWMAVTVWIGTCCLLLCAFLQPEAGCVAGVTGDLIKE